MNPQSEAERRENEDKAMQNWVKESKAAEAMAAAQTAEGRIQGARPICGHRLFPEGDCTLPKGHDILSHWDYDRAHASNCTLEDRKRIQAKLDSLEAAAAIKSGHDSEMHEEIRENPAYAFPGEKEAAFPLEEMLIGDINRLRYVTRFATAMVTHRENVAEHSFYVCTYAFIIGRWVQRTQPGLYVGTETILLKALVHDWDEARTGDMVRSFKHKHENVRKAVEAAAATELWEMLLRLMPGDNDGTRRIRYSWHSAKDNTPEGCIVALADYLAVVSHLWQEVNCANATIFQHYDSMLEHLAVFEEPRYNFLRPIIEQTGRLVRSVLQRDGRHKLPAERCSDVPEEM